MVQDGSNGMEPTAFEETFSAKFRSFDRNMIPFYKHRWAGVAILELSSSFKHELIDELKVPRKLECPALLVPVKVN